MTITAIRNESGALIGFAKVTRDLSERRLAEEQRETERHEAERVLRESEEKFRLLVAEVRDYAIFFLDLEGHVMTWNVGAERIKGYRADEIIGQSFVRFYVPEDVNAGVPSRLLQRATEQGVATDEGLRMRKDGSRFWAYVVLTALHDKAGRLRGFAKVTRDITEQKHAERRMAILADTSRLLGESLDSDQILFTITGMAVPNFADGVVIHLRDSEGEPRLGLFHATNPELLAAVRDLQVRGAYRVAAPSRRVMRTGRSEIHPNLTPEWLRGQDMDDDCDEPFPQLGRLFGALPLLLGSTKELRIVHRRGCAPCQFFRKDEVMLVEAPRPRRRKDDHSDGAPRHCDRDVDRRGDAKSQNQERQLNPFRLGERSSRSPAGLGLGLYISNEVIHRHGGQLEIRSTAVEGTTFRVVLPCEAAGNSGDQ